MSIKLMSAIFETEMRDLVYEKDGEQRKAKASTVKLVLLALADHANDYGESSYPGYDRLEIKTALSRQGLADTLDAMKQNGLLVVEYKGSRLGTNNYTINIRSFPPMCKEIAELPEIIKPLDSAQSSHLTNVSQATELESSVNHQINHPDAVLSEKELQQANAKVDAMILAGQRGGEDNKALIEFERAFKFGTLPWSSNSTWTKFQKFVVKIYTADPGVFADYVAWRLDSGKYKAFSNRKIRENPQAFMDTGYPEFEASKMYMPQSQPTVYAPRSHKL